MIVEGIVTTRNADGSTNIAAMGITLDPAQNGECRLWHSFVIRPFEGSRTFSNLRCHAQGVFHILDDAGLLARSALSDPKDAQLEQAEEIVGSILAGSVRAFEFVITDADWSQPRSTLVCQVLKTHDKKPWSGWNRAQNAVLELTIMATRVRMIPESEIRSQMAILKPLVEKTAGRREWVAWEFVTEYLETFWAGRRESEQGHLS